MSTIGENVINGIVKQLEGHLKDYMEQIDTAYCDQEDDVLSISLGAKLSPDTNGIKIVTTITFIANKIKDGGILVVDENQRQLFGEN